MNRYEKPSGPSRYPRYDLFGIAALAIGLLVLIWKGIELAIRMMVGA